MESLFNCLLAYFAQFATSININIDKLFGKKCNVIETVLSDSEANIIQKGN